MALIEINDFSTLKDGQIVTSHSLWSGGWFVFENEPIINECVKTHHGYIPYTGNNASSIRIFINTLNDTA